jgi:hypothetical protein
MYNQDNFVHIIFTDLYVDMCPCNVDCVPSHFIVFYRFNNVCGGVLHAVE